MTFKAAMIKAMTSRGMFPSQAEEVIVEYIESNKDNSMMDRWYESINDYPEAMQNILWTGVKDYAANWIKVNAPEAWFRPMFEYTESELMQMMIEKSMGV